MTHLKYLSLLFATSVLLGCASGAPRQPAPVSDSDSAFGSPNRTTTANSTPKKRRVPAPIQDRNAVVDDNLRDSNTTRSSPITVQRPQYYRVQKGDTLYSIGRKYNANPLDIADLNDLPDNTSLRVGQKLVLPVDDGEVAAPQADVVINKPRDVPVKNQPRVTRPATSGNATTTANGATSRPSAASPADEDIQWIVPAEGELIGGFSETGSQKGIEILGEFGQAIVASAAGEVVYSGSGLRGYGKLILIKHNPTFITAYAHNSRLLVKQGQMVEQGQQIAEMGNTDTNRVKLYFELRRFGKPVDPAKYLQLD
jgi:lipoprotein NlpD